MGACRSSVTATGGIPKSLQRHFDIENARIEALMRKRSGSVTMANGQTIEKYTMQEMIRYTLQDMKANGTAWSDFSVSILYKNGTQSHYGEGDDTSKMRLSGIQAVIEDNGSTLAFAGKGVKIENLNQTEAFAKLTRYGTSKSEDDWRVDFD